MSESIVTIIQKEPAEIISTGFQGPQGLSAYQISQKHGYQGTEEEWLAAIESGAGVSAQVQADWNATQGLARILNKPTLATVATSGSYNDLTNKPTIPTLPALAVVATSGSYNDLNNKPTIPAPVTKTSELQNDSDYQTGADVHVITDALSTLVNSKADLTYVDNQLATKGTSNFSGSYLDLSNRPTLHAVATTGNYNLLINKPAIPSIPSNVSAFINDTNYQSADQVDSKIQAVVGAAPAALDTLQEIATQLQNDQNAVAALTTTVSQKADLSYVNTQLATKGTSNFSGSYNDLTNKPSIPTVPTNVSAFTNDAGYLNSVSYSQVTGKPTNVSSFTNDAGYLSSVSWSQVTGKPAFAAVATTGSYNDLADKPSFTSTLAGSADVTITSPANGEVLTYDSTTSKWKNAAASSGGSLDNPDITNGFRSAGQGAVATNFVGGASAFGFHSTNSNGGNNVALGSSALSSDFSTNNNVAVGANALKLANSGISAITVVSGGSGFTSAPTIVISAPAGAGGIQATATCGISGGAVSWINISNPGKYYDSTVTVTTSGGGGSGATFSVILDSGSKNVVIGADALSQSGRSCEQVAIGYRALYNQYSSTSGDAASVAVGAYSLHQTIGSTQCVAVGYRALFSPQGNHNTGVGYKAGSGASSAVTGIACLGSNAGTNLTGNFVTALGYYAGASSSANNTWVGSQAGFLNSGAGNTAVGFNAIGTPGSGAFNAALGDSALKALTTGSYNSAVGFNALLAATTTNYNTAFGYNTLKAIVGSAADHNTAIGSTAGQAVTTGTSNTFVGSGAGVSVTTGYENVLVGRNAGNSLIDGNNVICIGMNAQASSTSATNQVTLGSSAITSLRCAVNTITSLSDKRDKTDIRDISTGLAFIKALRPVDFTWNSRDGTKVGIKDCGFIAQEVDEAQANSGSADYLNLILRDNPDKLELSAGRLIPVLVKAIQELDKSNNILYTKLIELEKRMELK